MVLKKHKNPPEITLQRFLILLSIFFSHKNFPSNTVIFRSPLSKHMRLLGLEGRQETWGPSAQSELRRPLTDQRLWEQSRGLITDRPCLPHKPARAYSASARAPFLPVFRCITCAVCARPCMHAHVQGCGGNGILVGRDLILLMKVILTFKDGGSAAQLKGEYMDRIKGHRLKGSYSTRPEVF